MRFVVALLFTSCLFDPTGSVRDDITAPYEKRKRTSLNLEENERKKAQIISNIFKTIQDNNMSEKQKKNWAEIGSISAGISPTRSYGVDDSIEIREKVIELNKEIKSDHYYLELTKDNIEKWGLTEWLILSLSLSGLYFIIREIMYLKQKRKLKELKELKESK